MTDSDTTTISLIDRERILAGWTWHRLSKATGIRSNRFSKWLSGQGEPTMRQCTAIAQAINVPIARLAGLAEPEPVPTTPRWRLELTELTVQLGSIVKRADQLLRDEEARKPEASTDPVLTRDPQGIPAAPPARSPRPRRRA